MRPAGSTGRSSADARAEECGVPAGRVVTTWSADELLAWTREGRVPARATGS
jgi:putative hydrolase